MASSAASWTSVIPTELPSLAGLTMSRGSAAPAANAAISRRTPARSAFQREFRTSRQSTTGIPSPRHRRLNTALSMPIAEAATPDPVYARSTASSIAWIVPSSPNGPCRPMTTTGAGSPAASRSMAAPALTGPSAPSEAGSS